MITLISTAQLAEALGISVASARQALWRAGYRERRGYTPAEAVEFAEKRGPTSAERIGRLVPGYDPGC